MILLVTINLSFSSPLLHHFFLSLSLFSFPYPCHGWFDTPLCNCIILGLSSCYGCILLATFPLQYQCTSPFFYCLLLLLVSIFFSSSIHLPVIFFSLSLSLVNITFPILFAIVSYANFDDLPFDGDERLIARRRISRINDDIVFRLKNGSSVDL